MNDTASVFNLAVARGTLFEKAVLKCFKQSGSDHEWYLQLEMRKASVDSLQLPGDESSPASASLTYETMVVVYQQPAHTNAELDGSSADDWSYGSDDSDVSDVSE